MVPVLDRPVMAHIVDLLHRQGFDDLIANLHYFPDSIKNYFGDALTYRFEEELLGTAGGVRNVADFFGDDPIVVVSGDALTDIDLNGLVERHRERRRHRHAHREEGARHARVRRGHPRRRRAHPGLPGEARSRRGALGPRQLRHLLLQPRDLRLLPRPSRSPTGPRTCSRRCSRTTCPSTCTRSTSYWNDVGSLDELKQGTFDALEGKLRIDGHRARRGAGRGRGHQLDDVTFVGPPVWVGRDVEIGVGTRADGPARDRRRLPHRRHLGACASRSSSPAPSFEAGDDPDRRDRRPRRDRRVSASPSERRRFDFVTTACAPRRTRAFLLFFSGLVFVVGQIEFNAWQVFCAALGFLYDLS